MTEQCKMETPEGNCPFPAAIHTNGFCQSHWDKLKALYEKSRREEEKR